MMLTAYIINYDEQLYALFKPFLAPVERIFGVRAEEHHHAHEKYKPNTIIVGVSNISVETIEALREKHLLLIEKNPAKTIVFKERGIHTLCTDVYNQDIYDELVDFSHARTVLSVVNDLNTNVYLIRKVREINKNVNIIVVGHTEEQGKRLYKAGATWVLLPDVTTRRMLIELLDDPKAVEERGKEYFQELQKHFVYRREL
jgi:voltage-gated potassium channel Kch